jgi:hypothetical protein
VLCGVEGDDYTRERGVHWDSRGTEENEAVNSEARERVKIKGKEKGTRKKREREG